MQKNLSTKIFLLILVSLTVGTFFQFFSLLYFPDSNIVLQKGSLVPLEPEQTLTQKFSINRTGLSKIQLLLRTPGIKFENGDNVQAQLADKNCEKTLRVGLLEKSFLNSDNLYEFNFSRLIDSSEKNFCLTLTFLPQKNTAKNIQLFTMKENETLSIRPVYQDTYFWQSFYELNQRMSQYKPWFLKNIFLTLIIFGFLFSSFFVIVLLVFGIS